MPKRKKGGGDTPEADLSVPIPIQTFLWRQTSPFIRRKLGKLCEASCVSFERVLVQNILHGLSPSLCEAISSISRWKMIQAAFPHVMHCCAALLQDKKLHNAEGKFDGNQTKLLYTLHWIILDAASECEDLDTEKLHGKSLHSYLHSLDTIQLFIYLFVPLIHILKDSDFQSLKLEPGLRLWQPLWDFRQPDVPCFSTPVKAKRVVLKAQRNLMKVNFNTANIYIGKGSSQEDLRGGYDGIYMGGDEGGGGDGSPAEACASPHAPLAHMSDICAWSTTETATSIEISCDICAQSVQNKNGELCCACGTRRSSRASMPPLGDRQSSLAQALPTIIDQEYVTKRLESCIASGSEPVTSPRYPNPDVLSASYFDVAVLRCLFCPQWSEDGVYWALRYIHQRLLEVLDESHREEHTRERSSSLPIPERDKPIPLDDPPVPPAPASPHAVEEPHLPHGHASSRQCSPEKESRKEPSFKRIKVSEIKHIIGGKVKSLRRRESSEQFDLDHLRHKKNSDDSRVPPIETLSNGTDKFAQKFNSVPSKIQESCEENGSGTEEYDSNDSCSDAMRRKSAPALRRKKHTVIADEDADEESSGSGGKHIDQSGAGARALSLKPEQLVLKPIITITSDSPDVAVPSMAPWFQKRNSMCSQRSEKSDKSESSRSTREARGALHRSSTDTQINYSNNDEIEEVSGSVFYINARGCLNYEVVLQAAHAVVTQECSPRLCGVLLNILNCLIDLNVVNKKQLLKKEGSESSTKGEENKSEPPSNTPQSEKVVKAPFTIAMETLVRIFRIMGCPHGCGDGCHSDSLRAQGIDLMTRLMKLNKPELVKFLKSTLVNQPPQEVMDFAHAFLGFCVDPCANVQSPQEKQGRKTSMGDTRSGYANNFGQPIGGAPTVEAQMIVNILEPLMTKFVDCAREINSQENIGLYCDVRQFINYVKELHGGIFRKVALGGLRNVTRTEVITIHNKDAASAKPSKMAPAGARRRSSMVGPAGGSINEQDLKAAIAQVAAAMGEDYAVPGKTRKSLFRRRTKKNLLPPQAASDSEILDDSAKSGTWSPRVSMSATEDNDMPSGQTSPRRTSAKYRRDSLKRDVTETSTTLNTGESITTKEKVLVNCYAVKSGMLRFSFMMESCQPGSLPDPPLIAALLELEAPVVSRAALLLECAHFVNRCNRGDWPKWMKLNLPGFRQTGLLNSRGQPSGYRRNLLLQKAAGRMFHQWGEAICNRLNDILSEESNHLAVVQNMPEDRKKEVKLEEEEDFLDESTVNSSGSECPYALKMVACQLLLEITTFLRETYQFIPRTRTSRKDMSWDKPSGSSRRWSSILSSPGHSERSNSRSSQGDPSHLMIPSPSPRRVSFATLPTYDADRSLSIPSVTLSLFRSPSERKISFAVLGQSEQCGSAHSSATSICGPDTSAPVETKGRRHKKLMRARRGSIQSSSFRRSFKLRREGTTVSVASSGPSGSVKRDGSQKSRKVSSHSLMSERSDDGMGDASVRVEDIGEESTGIMSDDQLDSTFDFPENDDQDYGSFMPWIKVIVSIANTSNFICEHQQVCHPHCYERQRRSCSRLVSALRKVYDSQQGDEAEPVTGHQHERRDTLREKLKRRESMFQPASPKRKESTPLLERMKVDVATARAKIIAALEKKSDEKQVQTKKNELPMLKYLKTHVRNLTHAPLSICTKAAPILADNTYIDMMPVAWELLLESDQELAASSASLFILSSTKVPDRVQELMTKELQHEDPDQRINAILRFFTLWRFRFQVWPRMEEGAHFYFKVPPPSIDFVLPSPTIGNPLVTVIDPPWQPLFKTKVEEVTINHEESKSIMTATTTRRKQQQEMIHRALLAEEDRRRAARENFLMTGVAVTQQAAYEPALHHTGEEHEEGGDEEKVEHVHSQHLQTAQHYVTSCICAAVLPIIHLLEDLEVNPDGVAVSEVAEKVIWACLTEEPALFLRMFLEKLTHRDKQEELVFLLRKLLYHVRELPPQTAHCLFNYLVGFVMFYVRSPTEGGQEAISEALSILWQIVPSVQGIFFKDLKQTLRKEQCDPTLLISASMPSAKKLIVHGPDLASIPSQFPISEDTQFLAILQDSLEFFNIEENEHGSYFLVDTKTNQMHNLNSYVRDFYFFRRNFYPQLSLVKMNPDDAFTALQKQALGLKLLEIGKVLFTTSVLQASQHSQVQSHVSFLHEELQKLPSFPRKALEAEFGLYQGEYGDELYGIDMLHKYVWAKLVREMFRGLSSTTTSEGDLLLFLNVINGVLVLHAGDTAILRICIATLINAARHFKQVFATNGFLMIMPTLLRVYSHNQANPLLRRAVEFTCKQFFLLHRNPFVLQTFGSVASELDMSACPGTARTDKVSVTSLFELLLALEHDLDDDLDILELVYGDKPLMALDFCYMEEADVFTLMDAVNMCVTVIAYNCDNARAAQMLTILEAILPQYLRHLETVTERDDCAASVRAELTAIANIAVAVKALLSGAEPLGRNFSGPQKHLEAVNTTIKVNQNHHGNCSPPGVSVFYDEPSDIRYIHMEEGLSSRRNRQAHDHDDTELNLKEFRRPRNSILTVVAKFYSHCSNRVKELKRNIADTSSVRIPELLDSKSHIRLADITHALLKIAPYDPATLACTGLRCYMLDILPITDWTQEAVRPALNLVLRRLERLFSKLYKKPALRRHVDWESAASMLKGVYSALSRFLFVAHLPHLKTLINVCLNIILADDGGVSTGEGGCRISDPSQQKVPSPQVFSSAVIKLTSMQMQALGEQFSLEQICGGMSVFHSGQKTISMLINLVLPLCVRMGCGRRGLKIVVVCFEKQLAGEWYRIAQCIKEFGTRVMGGVPLWQFMDFVVAHPTPLLMMLLPFIQYKMMKAMCETEQEYFLQHTVHQKLQGYNLTHPKCKSTLLVDLVAELTQITEELIVAMPSETRPRTNTMTTTRSDASPGRGSVSIPRSSSVHDLLEHQVRHVRLHTLAPDYGSARHRGARGLASSISTCSASSMSLASPQAQPRAGPRRISAVEGHHILEKFTQASVVDDEAVPEAGCIRVPCETIARSPNLQRNQPVVLRGDNVRFPSLQRSQRVVHRGTLRRHNHVQFAESIHTQGCILAPGQSKRKRKKPFAFLKFIRSLSREEPTEESVSGTADGVSAGTNSADLDTRPHRLQRQDAKSRKTFKIKRHRSTVKGNILRSATMKGSVGRYKGISGFATPPRALSNHGDLSHSSGALQTAERDDIFKDHVDDVEPRRSPRRQLHSDSTLPLQVNGNARLANVMNRESMSEMTSQNSLGGKEDSQKPLDEKGPLAQGKRGRYITKSRSTEESSGPGHAAAGTARGRIARHGARNRSRSPSSSPSRDRERSRSSSPDVGDTPTRHKQTYVTECDSGESLGEQTALLQSQDLSQSQSSLLIYFDDNDATESTCV